MTITLIGMPGSGKSSVGRLLAQRLGYAFVDVDPHIEARYGAQNLQQVLDALGSDAFLDLEADVCASLSCDNTVLAPGGSAVLREKGIFHLKELGPVVYLRVPCDVLVSHLGNLATRGVTLAPGQTIADLLEYRRPFYEKYADVTVDGGCPDIRETVERVIEALGAHSCNFPKI